MAERIVEGKFRWILTGERVPIPFSKIYSKPIIALAIAMLAFAIGTICSLVSNDISESTLRFFRHEWQGELDWPVLFFWSFLLLWVIMLYLKILVDTDEKRNLRAAIARCPDPRILSRYYRGFIGAVKDVLAQPITETEEGEEPILMVKLSEKIQSVLRLVCKFSYHFAARFHGQTYRANIMLFRETTEPMPDAILSKLRFFNQAESRVEALRAVLYVSSYLTSGDKKPFEHDYQPIVPMIALPVPHQAFDEEDRRKALPGAPFAFLEGQQSVYEDTEKIADEYCKDFDRYVRDEVEKYFGPKGEGSNIKSFASMRIGNSRDPIGVLNIDSDSRYLLGKESEYNRTFHTLMMPVLLLLSDYIRQYRDLAQALDVC